MKGIIMKMMMHNNQATAFQAVSSLFALCAPSGDMACEMESPPVEAEPEISAKPAGSERVIAFQHLPSGGRGRHARFRGAAKDPNVPHGAGVLHFEGGDFYEGSFDNGRPHGHGRFVAKRDGSVTTGWFERGRPRKGMRLSPSGDRYTGEFHPALPGCIFHGPGELRFANGDKYEGMFAAGHFSGYGAYTFADGVTVISPEWVLDEPTGLTRVEHPNGQLFSCHLSRRGRTLTEGRGFVHFENGSWLESKGFGPYGALPTESNGGRIRFSSTLARQRWLYTSNVPSSSLLPTLSAPLIRSADPSKRVWLIFPSDEAVVPPFSARPDSQAADTSFFTGALAICQRAQYFISSLPEAAKERISWVTLGDRETSPLSTAIKSVTSGDATRVFTVCESDPALSPQVPSEIESEIQYFRIVNGGGVSVSKRNTPPKLMQVNDFLQTPLTAYSLFVVKKDDPLEIIKQVVPHLLKTTKLIVVLEISTPLFRLVEYSGTVLSLLLK